MAMSLHRFQVPAALVALILLWGTTWAAIRIGLGGIPPFAGVALRFALAGVILLLAAVWLKVPLGRLPQERWLWLTNGLLTFCLSYGIVYWSEQWLPSGLTSVLFATFPLFVAVFAHFWLPEETLSHSTIGGIVLSFVGVMVIFSEDLSLLGGPQVARTAAILLIAPCAAALANTLVKRWGKEVHPISLSAVPMLIAAAVMGILSGWCERHVDLRWDAVSLGALLYLVIFGSAITFSLYYWLLARLPATRLAIITYAMPVVAVVVGIVGLNERLTARVMVGTLGVVAGVALTSRHH